ncbi:MAG: HAD family phosphatase [Armatimonadota bacterium]|nr:HAD family phosphatase [bacterium]
MEELTRPAAVLFDMDGVLVDSEPWHIESYIRAFSEVGLTLTTEVYRQNIIIGQLSVRELFYSLGGDKERWEYVFKRKMAHTKKLMSEHLEIMPGTIRLLEMLKAEGIPTALVTSAGKQSLDVIMGKYNLLPYFDHVMTWEDVRAIKPDPDGYIKAAQVFGVKPKDCVVFEDSPRGVLAAHRAGMKCIAVPTGTTHDGDFSLANVVVSSLEDATLDLLQEL